MAISSTRRSESAGTKGKQLNMCRGMVRRCEGQPEPIKARSGGLRERVLCDCHHFQPTTLIQNKELAPRRSSARYRPLPPFLFLLAACAGSSTSIPDPAAPICIRSLRVRDAGAGLTIAALPFSFEFSPLVKRARSDTDDDAEAVRTGGAVGAGGG